jgi:hypothetical protein
VPVALPPLLVSPHAVMSRSWDQEAPLWPAVRTAAGKALCCTCLHSHQEQPAPWGGGEGRVVCLHRPAPAGPQSKATHPAHTLAPPLLLTHLPPPLPPPHHHHYPPPPPRPPPPTRVLFPTAAAMTVASM